MRGYIPRGGGFIPLLGEARQKKVDEAIQILQMLRLLPLLKESGVFSGLLSGLL